MVILATTPGDAAAVGRDRSRPLRQDWEQVKDYIMFDALTAKFLQYDDLLHILMSTKGSKLVEHTRNDKYWGDGGDGSGKNMLGKLLMLLRDVLEKVDLKTERSKINEIMREKGENPLRSMIAPTNVPGEYVVVVDSKMNDDFNDDDDNSEQVINSKTSRAAATTSSKAQQQQKKNRLQ